MEEPKIPEEPKLPDKPVDTPPHKSQKPMMSLFKNKWARITLLGMAGLVLMVWVAAAISKP